MAYNLQKPDKILKWISFLLLLVASENFVSGKTDVSNYPHVTLSNNTRCGKILTGSTGGIFYKPFIQVQENERCVWQITVPDAKGYTMKFHYFGFNWENVSRREQGIVILSYSRHNSALMHYPNTTDTIKFPNCNLLVVTFYTGLFETAMGTTGFVLEYETIFEGQNAPEIAKESKHYNIGESFYFLKHPSNSDGEKYYQRNELSTFVFLPSNNLVRNETNNTIIYYKLGLINSRCMDRLKIYFFNINDCEKKIGWIFQGKICANTEVEAISSSEPILIIFESDDNYSKSYGFQFSYVVG